MSSGCTISPGDGKVDYSASPTGLAVFAPDGSYRSYAVELLPVVAYAAATAVRFTEYYMGSGSGYEGELNRWIELTNVSPSAIDLSQYVLAHRARTDGTRDASRDVLAPLSGTLAAGSSMVICSSRLDTATFSAWAAKGAGDIVTSDLYLNTIADFDGDDGLQLLRDGTVLDCVGPNGGTGADYYWGRNKRMLRKTTAGASATWDEKEWVAYTVADAIADAANAAANTAAFASTNTNLTFFAFEDLKTPAYATINTTAHTVSIAVEETVDRSALKAFFSTEGLGIQYNGDLIYSGVTAIDYRSPVSFLVFGNDGITSATYTVTVTTYHVLGFTSTNYDFSGGIQATVDKLVEGGADTTALTGTLEGIVTGKDLYINATYQYCFIIQDKDQAVLFMSSSSISPPIGARIQVPVTGGTCYSSLVCEITAFGAVTRVGSDIHDLYYQSGNYALPAAISRVYMWEGNIESGPSSYVGTFEGNLYFHTTSALWDSLSAGVHGSFYGPITLSSGKYRMELFDAVQLDLQ